MSKAAATKFANEVATFGVALTNAFDMRCTRETRDVETMSAKERDVATKKVHKIRTYFKSANHVDCFAVMLQSGVDANFINEEKTKNIYTAKKVCELASYLAKRDYSLDMYDLIAFRTLVLCHKAGVLATRHHIQDGICHDRTLNEAESALVFRIAGKHKDMSTAKAQDTSSLANLSLFGICTKATDANGNSGFRLNVDAFATTTLAALLNIEL